MSFCLDLLLKKLRNRFPLWLGTLLRLPGLLIVYLLNDALLVAHLSHHLVSLLQGIDEQVDPLVELVQVHLHVLLLALEVLWLLVRVEIFQLVFGSVFGLHVRGVVSADALATAVGVVTFLLLGLQQLLFLLD